MPLEPLPNRQGSVDRKRDAAQGTTIGNQDLRIPGQQISQPNAPAHVTSPSATQQGISDFGQRLDRLLSGRQNSQTNPVASWAQIPHPDAWFSKEKEKNALTTIPRQDIRASAQVEPANESRRSPSPTNSRQVVRLKV